jgi:hypothetical protein
MPSKVRGVQQAARIWPEPKRATRRPRSSAASRNADLKLSVHYHLKLLVDKYRTIVLVCFSRAVIVYRYVCKVLAAAARSGRLLPRRNDPPAENNGKTNGRNRDKNGGYSDGP